MPTLFIKHRAAIVVGVRLCSLLNKKPKKEKFMSGLTRLKHANT